MYKYNLNKIFKKNALIYLTYENTRNCYRTKLNKKIMNIIKINM